jgi:NADH:ubiquinone oxidoreductase subunit F (NADH-binding)/NADPH-dependent glutamate synthase beta subunit-like oxidoreductase/(2Fe-2S) ferredoxin
MKIESIKDLEAISQEFRKKLYYPEAIKVNIGMASCGIAAGAKASLEAAIKEFPGDNGVSLNQTGCLGFCELEPLVEIFGAGKPRVLYKKITEDKIIDTIQDYKEGDFNKKLILGQMRDPRSLLEDDIENPLADVTPLEKIPFLEDIPFYNKQVKIALRNCGYIDPDSIEEYIAKEGYFAFIKVLTDMQPKEIIEAVKESGLRGRGGGGFPAGVKWATCAKHDGDRYVICNADEGDPGAYMDRSILEGDPHSVLEGMLIAALAIGSNQGFIYVRNEYPLAVKRLVTAIKAAEKHGLIGDNIAGSDFSFNVKISTGAGAFVCGESTALMASLEGQVGRPRAKYVHTVEKGFRQSPSNLNNVETYANVPAILLKGAKSYAEMGTKHSKGTKVFSLVGKIKNTGLVEVPMGVSLKDIVFDIGGGVPGKKKFKAVQTGGPSGGCIPEQFLNLGVDFDELSKVGSIMGSGGMIVMDQDTCMVDVARYFLDFLQEESCGQCNPCREGIRVMLEILTDICAGNGKEGDVELLEELGAMVQKFSLCGLGTSAPNPVLTTILYFRDEYDAHIRDKKCPAGVCKELFHYEIDQETCNACQPPCKMACPVGVDAHGYVNLIEDGKYKEAVELIREELPFPGILGRVCTHPCEVSCHRADVDEAIAICELKRFAADQVDIGSLPVPEIEYRDEMVAIIGSGPAGLSCAYFLALEGYRSTVFEALPVTGGMLRTGIPSYRLPRDVLDAEIAAVERLGVEIKVNSPIDRNFGIEKLLQHGYKAVFIGVGAHKGLKLSIPGEDKYPTVKDCVLFLREVNLGLVKALDGNVVTIGGGYSAIDCARTSLRMGAGESHIVYRRTRNEMLADAHEIDQAVEEGVQIHFLAAPLAIEGEDGNLKGLKCIRTHLTESDSTGRRRPVPIEGSEFFIECDHIVPAIGQEPDLSFIDGSGGVEVSKWNLLEINPANMMTNREGVFAGGDAVTGPATVIEAVEAGKTAAYYITAYLKGKELPSEWEDDGIRIDDWSKVVETVPAARRASTPTSDPVRRRSNFEEANLAFSAEEARRETQRCLNCGACYRKCPQGAITAEGMDPRRIDQEKCIKCSICYYACQFDAILIK